MGLLSVVMFAARLTAPLPSCAKAPVKFIAAPDSRVKGPLLVTCTGPLPVVVTAAWKANSVPVRTIPAGCVVVSAPVNVVLTVPACCVIDPALITAKLALPALLIVTEFTGVVAPMDAET